MNPSAHTLKVVCDALATAVETFEGFAWFASADLPNGRYVVDHDRNHIYLDGSLSGDAAHVAFMDALAELHRGAPTCPVVPLYSRRLTTHAEHQPSRQVTTRRKLSR